MTGDLRPIAAGTFVMGAPDGEFGKPPYDQNQVQVTLTHAFELGATEVTQSEWESLCVADPSGIDKTGVEDCIGPTCPVGGVTWFDAIAWLNKLSVSRGLSACYRLDSCDGEIGEHMKCQSAEVLAASVYQCDGYRLPTEFEFEYAARAGTTTAFYSGDITSIPSNQDPDTCIFDANLDKIGWYCWNSGKVTHPVAGKVPNAWGLFDIVGNALEWTHSKYTPNGYGTIPLVDPPGTASALAYGDAPTTRGGIYNFSSRSARAAWRGTASNYARGAGLGFRIARTMPQLADGGVDAKGSDAEAE
ncbi:SUMF1/EgtB/PvdO family nonheme iron enzyme [soil metagenome]